MNEKKTKQLRKKIYGDLALNSEEIRQQVNSGGTVINIGLRKEYQKRKAR